MHLMRCGYEVSYFISPGSRELGLFRHVAWPQLDFRTATPKPSGSSSQAVLVLNEECKSPLGLDSTPTTKSIWFGRLLPPTWSLSLGCQINPAHHCDIALLCYSCATTGGPVKLIRDDV
jgi:hypothetical protein